jgi:hypothetical protein
VRGRLLSAGYIEYALRGGISWIATVNRLRTVYEYILTGVSIISYIHPQRGSTNQLHEYQDRRRDIPLDAGNNPTTPRFYDHKRWKKPQMGNYGTT